MKKIILGMGGSATVNGGIGILKVLGVHFLNAQERELPSSPGHLTKLTSINLSVIDKRIKDCEVIVLCNVGNHFLKAG